MKQNTIFLFTNNADYTVSYSNNINAGTVTVTIMEIGSYEGTTGKTFQITSRSMGEVTVEKIGKSAVFFGKIGTKFCAKNRIIKLFLKFIDFKKKI